MKKLWNDYSYAIILVVISCLAAFILNFKYDATNKEDFKTVTVTEGDTIWELADSFSGQHEMTTVQFVQWVKKNNDIDGDQIFPGEDLVIPVTKEVRGTELAGIINE